MSSISSIGNVSAAYADQVQQSAPKPKLQQSQSGQDSVHLSKAAQAALNGADADHDGDSH